jgi:hypothetical protein
LGVDIYIDSGILFTLEDAVNKFFKGLNKKSIAEIVDSCSDIVKDENDLHFLKSIANTEDLKSWFIGSAQKLADESEHPGYFNGVLTHEEFLSLIWHRVIDKTKFTNLPQVRFKYFKSNRYSGYDVPANTICVVFDDSGLFENKMSTQGKAVAKLMGLKSIEKTTWTVYSC